MMDREERIQSLCEKIIEMDMELRESREIVYYECPLCGEFTEHGVTAIKEFIGHKSDCPYWIALDLLTN